MIGFKTVQSQRLAKKYCPPPVLCLPPKNFGLPTCMAVTFTEYSVVASEVIFTYPTGILLANETCPLFGQQKYTTIG